MRTTIILFLLVIGLGAVILLRTSAPFRALPSGEKSKLEISLIEAGPAPANKEPVRELDYFENQKDISNWFFMFLENGLIKPGLSGKAVSQGKNSMRVEWTASGRSELVLVHFPQDWSGYTHLKFDIFNPDERAFDIKLKIGDFAEIADPHGGRKEYGALLRVLPGWNNYDVPSADIGAKINIGAVRKAIVLQALRGTGSSEPRLVFNVDNMRLTQ
jgi:hypothetical protein